MTNQFPLDSSQYLKLHLIGNSSNADVYLARCIPNNQLIALKEYDLECTNVEIGKLAQEVLSWSEINHPNAVKYYGSFTSGSKICFIMECIDGGSLSDILQDCYPKGLQNELLISTILRKVLLFLDYFHSNQQLHRNLKTNKILVSMDGEIKVCGFFNVSGLIQDGVRKSSRKSTMEFSTYAAPEVLDIDRSKRGYSISADIWSLGIISIEIATGKVPFSDLSVGQQMNAIINSPPPSLPDGFSQEFRDFVNHCLVKDPEKRSTAHKLLKHDFILKAKDNEYIETILTSQLPPLIHRLEKRNLKKQAIITENSKQPSIRTEFIFPGEDKSKPKKETEVTKIQAVKKGRFTFSVIPSS